MMAQPSLTLLCVLLTLALVIHIDGFSSPGLFLACQTHVATSSTTSLRLWDKVIQVMEELVGKTSILENDDGSNIVDHEQVLETFELQSFTDISKLVSAYESLINYLQLWARNLELYPDKGLTTPVTATGFRNVSASSYSYLQDSPQNHVIAFDMERYGSREVPPNISMTLKFQPPKRYLSYKEQKGMEKGTLPDRKGAKVDAWSPGSVQLRISILERKFDFGRVLSDCKVDEPFQLHLEARRCDIDGDTVIKYSSERAIIRRLKEAVRIWIKVHEM